MIGYGERLNGKLLVGFGLEIVYLSLKTAVRPLCHMPLVKTLVPKYKVGISAGG